jgi:hypothetical protein
MMIGVRDTVINSMALLVIIAGLLPVFDKLEESIYNYKILIQTDAVCAY